MRLAQIPLMMGPSDVEKNKKDQSLKDKRIQLFRAYQRKKAAGRSMVHAVLLHESDWGRNSRRSPCVPKTSKWRDLELNKADGKIIWDSLEALG